MRWIASMVAEAHRILMRGGVFMYPRDTKDPAKPGRLRLAVRGQPDRLRDGAGRRPRQHGREPVLGVQPGSLHQRIGLVFGSKNEVERIERYHAEADAGTDKPFVSPSVRRALAVPAGGEGLIVEAPAAIRLRRAVERGGA